MRLLSFVRRSFFRQTGSLGALVALAIAASGVVGEVRASEEPPATATPPPEGGRVASDSPTTGGREAPDGDGVQEPAVPVGTAGTPKREAASVGSAKPADRSAAVGSARSGADAAAVDSAKAAGQAAPIGSAKPVALSADGTKSDEPKVEFSGAPGKGFTAKFGKAFSLNVKSRFQFRYELSIPDQGDARAENLRQSFGLGTVRLWLSGHVLRPELTYFLQLALAPRDFRDGAVSPVYDAYVDWKAHRNFSVRVGQYFVPFDRLRTVREFALQMIERPRPVAELTLDRDVGITAYSDAFLGPKSPVAWRLGVFGGGGANPSLARRPGTLVVGRVELRPLGSLDDDQEGDHERRKKPALALGGAFAANFHTNRLRSTTGPTFQGGTTTYYHAAADLVFKARGLALQGEYLWKRAIDPAIVSTAADGTPRTEATRSGQGFVTQASYTFDPPIELVARFSRLYANRGTDPTFVDEVQTLGQELGAGLNYYVASHRFKVQATWIARMPHGFVWTNAAHVVLVALDMTF